MPVNTDPTPRDLRLFGLILPAFMVLAGVVFGHRFHSVGVTRAIWALGAVLTVAYAGFPSVRRPFFVGLGRLTYPIGWVVSHVVLTIVFFMAVTPVAVLLRVLRRDILDRRLTSTRSSYWTPRPPPTGDVNRYFHQF